MTAPAVTQLSELHRQAQARVSADVARQVVEAWGIVDPFNVDRTWPLVYQALTQIIARGYAASTATAITYLQAHAGLNGVALTGVAVGDPINLDQLAVSLRVTGPVAVKTAAGLGLSPTAASATALVRLIGSSTRLTLLGGRGTIGRTSAGSPEIVGYRRVTSAGDCDFCSMLASRGAVYKTVASASIVVGRGMVKRQGPARPGRQPGGIKARGARSLGSSFHDHCHCSVEPIYVGQVEPADIAAHVARYGGWDELSVAA